MRYDKRLNRISLSRKKIKNYIKNENNDYIVRPLRGTNKNKNRKGGNSSVFILYDPNENCEYIIKFCNSPETKSHSNRVERFNHEIDALNDAKKNDTQNIIKYHFDGYEKIDGKTYHYYVMEKGECDLRDYLEQNTITNQQKLVLIASIIRGIKELHSLGIYHRDIKPDNIFFIDDVWKIGDLGLSARRDKDLDINEFRMKIGPYGWMSPEVMNKVLCEGTDLEKKYSCVIDYKSDIFQLGLIFWYIFQGNVPLGQLNQSDFILQDSELFDVIFKMLEHSKNRRFNDLEELETQLESLLTKYAA